MHAADLSLDVLRGRLPDRQPVVGSDPGRDGLVEVVAAHPQRARDHDPAQGDHRHLAGAAAHVDHHVGARLVDLQARPDGRRQRLLDQVHRARSGGHGGLREGAALHVGDARGRAHDQARVREAAAVHPADEVTQHLLGHLEVGDHAVSQRADRGDGGRGAADHALGLLADGVHLAVAGVDGHHRGLGHHDALAAHVHERVGRAQVDREVAAPEAGHERAAQRRPRSERVAGRGQADSVRRGRRPAPRAAQVWRLARRYGSGRSAASISSR